MHAGRIQPAGSSLAIWITGETAAWQHSATFRHLYHDQVCSVLLCIIRLLGDESGTQIKKNRDNFPTWSQPGSLFLSFDFLHTC